ncbi:CubicO group peptidase (beta-lactamase class C family) [Runella defluvii]|uniref:CubicO group peptidase (Beta-lactamase class C family) n=1 Tax=Runella defluvii TaxID=370973 RepID=A0A7W6EPD6_9BACT|nr:serine hydrolase domain-containing protein [Runella defluvii]MBB3837480.1 CubicO group peptidase (beta-lactamase class C family) [Runella defluvii]
MRKTTLLACLIFSISTALLGQNPSQATKIDQFLQAMAAKSNIPGFAIAVVTKDSVILSKGYGIGSDNRPITSQTPFAIASLSKAFTAMSVMQLAAAHKIDISSPVKRYIPSFELDDPRGQKITVDHLLHQTSGLNDKVFPELAFHHQPTSLNEAISRLKNVKLGVNPGTKFRYHNPNYQILAQTVESVSQQAFPHYLEQQIFKPLGMNNTKSVSLTKSFSSSSARFQNGHIFALGKPISIQEPDWFVEGAAGMVSNAEDMSKWLRLQLNHGQWNGASLLDSVHLKMMQTSTKTSPYGMGWFVAPNGTISHSGILWTYSAEQMISANGYGIVILFNGGINLFEDYHAFIQGVADILDNKTADVPIVPSWLYPLCAFLIGILSIGLATRRLFRQNHWYKNYVRRPAWLTILFLFTRTLPLILFLCSPYLLTAISGRVLNWKRIFLMGPDITVVLTIIVLLNTLVVVRRLYFLAKLR